MSLDTEPEQHNINSMGQREALTHVLLLCEAYKSRVAWEITAPIVIDSLHQQGLTTPELHAFLHDRVKSKTIHEFLPYVKAHHDRQTAFQESFESLKNRSEAVRPYPKLVRPKSPRPKGLMK